MPNAFQKFQSAKIFLKLLPTNPCYNFVAQTKKKML